MLKDAEVGVVIEGTGGEGSADTAEQHTRRAIISTLGKCAAMNAEPRLCRIQGRINKQGRCYSRVQWPYLARLSLNRRLTDF
jgi:hypothetical protein